jgi:hypothetical protein
MSPPNVPIGSKNGANGSREIAASDTAYAGDELVASQSRVIDMNDAVSRRDIDIPVWESPRPRARNVMFG